VAAVWWCYVWWRIGEPPFAGGETTAAFPLSGVIEAARTWVADGGTDLVVGIVLVLLCGVALYQAIRRPSAVSWAGGALVLLAIAVSAPSWLNWYDMLRVLALPLLTVPLVAVGARRALRRRELSDLSPTSSSPDS
jgi:hypothetical protein